MGKTPAPDATLIARLQFANINSGVRSIELLSGMTIGRSRDCDIFLEDLTVSRHHATINEIAQGQYEIVDNRSATGTFVNGQPITRYTLHEGDQLQIGNTILVFRLTRA